MRAVLLWTVLAVARGATLVRDLDPDNWERLVPNRRWLVYFALTGCSHCERLAPMMQRLAELAPDIMVGRVNATAHNGIARSFEVKRFPTILLLDDDGLYYEHQGPRSLQALMSFGRALPGTTGGGRLQPGALQPNVSDWWLLAEAVWDPLKIALKWSVGIAMGMKLLALCMLRILESLGGRGEGEGDDGDRDVKPSSSSHGDAPPHASTVPQSRTPDDDATFSRGTRAKETRKSQ